MDMSTTNMGGPAPLEVSRQRRLPAFYAGPLTGITSLFPKAIRPYNRGISIQ